MLKRVSSFWRPSSGSYSNEQKQSAERGAEVLRVASTTSNDTIIVRDARGTKRKADETIASTKPSPPTQQQSESEPNQSSALGNKILLTRPKKTRPKSSRPPKGPDVFEVDDDQAIPSTQKSTAKSPSSGSSKGRSTRQNNQPSENLSHDAEHPEVEDARVEAPPARNTRSKRKQTQATEETSTNGLGRTRKQTTEKSDEDARVNGNQESVGEDKATTEDVATGASKGRPRGKKRRVEGNQDRSSGPAANRRGNGEPAYGAAADDLQPNEASTPKSVDSAVNENTEEESVDQDQADENSGDPLPVAWTKFKVCLEKIREKKADQTGILITKRAKEVKEFLRIIKDAVHAYHTLEEATDPSSSLAMNTDHKIEDFLAKLKSIGTQLRSGLQENAGDKQLLRDIYLEMIPKLSGLLEVAYKSNSSRYGTDIDTWTVSSLGELVTVMDLIIMLCNKAYGAHEAYKPKDRPSLPGVIRGTQSLKVILVELRKPFYTTSKRKVAHEQHLQLEQQLREATAFKEVTMARKEKEHAIKCEERWVQIMTELHQHWPLPPSRRYHARPENEVDFTPGTPLQVENGVSIGSPELGEDHDPLLRTPLTARSQRMAVVDNLPRRTLTFDSSEEREWSAEEEQALINGLQEYQGPSRYFDIFNAYSGRELVGRDMDAIKRKAKSLKASLINEMRGAEDYDDYEFLWSVAD